MAFTTRISVAVSELKSANAAICPVTLWRFTFFVSRENLREASSRPELASSNRKQTPPPLKMKLNIWYGIVNEEKMPFELTNLGKGRHYAGGKHIPFPC